MKPELLRAIPLLAPPPTKLFTIFTAKDPLTSRVLLGVIVPIPTLAVWACVVRLPAATANNSRVDLKKRFIFIEARLTRKEYNS